MKNLYFFEVGRYPDLSLAELKSVFTQLSYPFKLIQHANHIALVESTDINVRELNTRFGGIVKFGKVIETLPLQAIENLKDLFTIEVLQHEFVAPELSKVEFGVSMYVSGGGAELAKQLFEQHEAVTFAIKESFESSGIKAHFPQLREHALSSASVEKNKLLTRGAEMVVILTQDELLIGKTLAVQQFESFSKRDMGRPTRDMKSGVMPPKIARMMINISGVSLKDTLLDPFCGSGTLLQEALDLGIQNIIGTDISEKAIRDSKENISWYLERINSDAKEASIRIEKADVTKLSGILKKDSVDAIVTEPYLGPTLKNRAHPEQIRRTENELSRLYVSAFEEFTKVLKPGGSVVIILPAFQARNVVYLDILSQIKSLGFTIEKLSGSQRETIVVGNKYDYVLREIGKFVKK